MPRLTKFEEYCDRYSDSYVLEMTDDGILLVRMHTDGGPVNWNKAVLATPDLFGDIAGDRDVRIVIYTGTGENFNADFRPTGDALEAYAARLQGAPQRPAEEVEAAGWFGRNRHNNMSADNSIPATETPRAAKGTATRPVPIANSIAAPPPLNSTRQSTVASRTSSANIPVPGWS